MCSAQKDRPQANQNTANNSRKNNGNETKGKTEKWIYSAAEAKKSKKLK